MTPTDPRSTQDVGRTGGWSDLRRQGPSARRQWLVDHGWLDPEEAEVLAGSQALTEEYADAMIENVIGRHMLPLGLALNFIVNGRERLIPMAVEEPSIVAAASCAAKLARTACGFLAEADPPIVTAQVELREIEPARAARALRRHSQAILAAANALMPRMVQRGGGARGLTVRPLEGGRASVDVHVDCCDSLGANLANRVAEGISPLLARLTGARVGVRIVTNLADHRKVRVTCRVRLNALATPEHSAVQTREGIVAAQGFAEADVYRAVTHNKGIMNGVDAVLVACGNDWRAVEAGAHAFAARHGRYAPLTRWRVTRQGDLEGVLVMPLAASTVGGAAIGHAGVRLALRLARIEGGVDLACLAGAAGLATNLAALRALATTGIQKGHMALHARRIAVEGGARGRLVDEVAQTLWRERDLRGERAQELLMAAMKRATPGADDTPEAAPPGQ